MKYRKCTIEDLQRALNTINPKYGDNIAFNRLDSNGFTLRVKDSKKAGHRLGQPKFLGFDKGIDYAKRRRLPYACWHVHGDFFDALFTIQPEAEIVSSGSLANPLPVNKITKGQGNWQDWNIGSRKYPYYMSEACECN